MKEASPRMEIKVLYALKDCRGNSPQVAERAGVTSRTAKRALNQLKKAGVVNYSRSSGWTLA